MSIIIKLNMENIYYSEFLNSYCKTLKLWMYLRDTYIVLVELFLVVCCSSMIGVGPLMFSPIGVEGLCYCGGEGEKEGELSRICYNNGTLPPLLSLL